jgi:hypothetical protein
MITLYDPALRVATNEVTAVDPVPTVVHDPLRIVIRLELTKVETRVIDVIVADTLLEAETWMV